MALKLFEYLASGSPIVASDMPLNKEFLRDGKNAVIFKADDSRALAGALLAVIKHPALAKRISQKAANDSKNYSYDTRAKKIISFLKRYV